MVPAHHDVQKTQVFKFFAESMACAQLLQHDFQTTYIPMVLNVLEGRNQSAHWRTGASLEAAVSSAKDLIVRFPDVFGSDQVLIIENFHKLKALFGKM